MSPEVPRTSPCWDCGSLSPWRRIAVESVIHARSKADGGPYRTYQCPACRIEVGALASPMGTGNWMLYPLRGLDEPGLLDRLLPSSERKALERAHRWWRDNRDRVEQYRRGHDDAAGEASGGEREAEPEVPRPAAGRARRGAATSQRRSSTTQRGAATEPRARRTPPPRPPRDTPPPPPPRPSPRPPDPLRAALGLAADAGLPEIRRAYRVLAKRWHPDRVGGDAAAQREATRRFREIRAAYESLVAQLG